MKRINNLFLSSVISIVLASCGSNQVSNSNTDNESNDISNNIESSSDLDVSLTDDISSSFEFTNSVSNNDSSVLEPDKDIVDDLKKPTIEVMSKLQDYNPITFDKNSYKTTTEKLGDGVELVVAELKLNNGSTVKPYCVVVDLKKANIVAGSYENSTSGTEYKSYSTPIAQALAWKKANPSKDFLAVTNADFFGNNQPVNAFVKDGVILKPAHNEDLGDVPESKPMLFGVSSAGARISPISTLENYLDNQNSTISTKGFCLFDENKEPKGNYNYVVDLTTFKDGISVVTTDKQKNIQEGSKVYKFKKIQPELCDEKESRGIIVEDVTGVTTIKNDDLNYGYIVIGAKTELTLNVNDYFLTENKGVFSKGGEWNFYDTIIGCRHSLIENGVLPTTLNEESSNGAQSRVPRTAVGIKDDGKVVIVSVEDLHYGGKSSVCTGMNIVQLADFMRYFGCYDAANFDGGGSSQLVTNKNGQYVVETRSSDTGSTEVEQTRKVINSIIVTTK